MVMVKNLKKRSVIVLIAGLVVLVGLVAASVLLPKSVKNEAKKQSINNLELIQKALISQDEKLCDQITGETRQEYAQDVKSGGPKYAAGNAVMTEEQARKQCHDSIQQIFEYKKMQQAKPAEQ